MCYLVIKICLHLILYDGYERLSQISSTIFLTQQYSQEQDLKNGTITSQIGPQVPSGLIFKVQSLFSKYLLTFRSRASWTYFVNILAIPLSKQPRHQYQHLLGIGQFLFFFFLIQYPPFSGIAPRVGTTEVVQTPTLDSALLCSSRAGTDLGGTSDFYQLTYKCPGPLGPCIHQQHYIKE